jgi:hypothetical protein
MYGEKKCVVSNREMIESLASPISHLTNHTINLPGLGEFVVDLQELSKSRISIEQFDDYKLLVNRLADISLTILSKEYYKFHPDFPYILRDEPYFDADLIERTGILDSKRYFRGLQRFNNLAVFVLNRETQLRSNRNLLNEMKSLKKRYESMSEAEIDFYNPPEGFVAYVNSLLRGKAADVKGYPGPRIRKIREVTWEYRASDTLPGFNDSPIEYLARTYGLAGFDPLQPLVVYGIDEGNRIQYHLPEVLSVGHTFRDLEKRIPSWQRPQVWGSVHPDCKNQLHKIYEVLLELDGNLRRNLPQIYPDLVEISTKALDVTTFVTQAIEPKLHFGNREIILKRPYDTTFYRSYSGKRITFARPASNTKAMVCLLSSQSNTKEFLELLVNEFNLRNNSKLDLDYRDLDLDKTDYGNYQCVITVGDIAGDNEEIYGKCKRLIQNEIGLAHQHITLPYANQDSVMSLVMQLTLKLGGDP